MANFTKIQKKRMDEIASRVPTIPPFAEDTPEKKKHRKEMVMKLDWSGFKFVAETYFPHVFRKNFCSAHRNMIELVLSNEKGLTVVTGFRGFGKTVDLAIVFNIWQLMRGDIQYIAQSAATDKLAQMRIKFIINELTNNCRIIHDYPKLQPDRAEDEGTYLKNKSLVQALSIEMQFRGAINPLTAKRMDCVIHDDIDLKKNQGNQSIGFNKLEKITQEVQGCLDPDVNGRQYHIWLGNLAHPNYAICQLEKQLETDPMTEKISFRGGKHLRNGKTLLLRYSLETGQKRSMWEEQYPTSVLPQLRRDFGMTGYQREFLGKAVIQGKVFKNEWFKQMDMNGLNGRWGRNGQKMLNAIQEVWLYSDPARGTKGCFKGITAIAFDGLYYYMVRCWVRQTDNEAYFTQLYDAFVELRKLYGYRFKAGIETTFGQGDVLKEFDRWCTDNGKTPIAMHFHRVDNKENKFTRIESLETVIQSGKLIFPLDGDVETLRTQFLTYPDGYLDGPDMTVGCMERFGSFNLKGNRVKVRRMVY